jgi:Ca2+-binding EF-hand superfamily protein
LKSLLQDFFRKSDANNSGDIDKAEFVNYLREHEQQLHIVFTSLDENKDGKEP